MAEGDTPAPQRPDLAYSHGHTGGSPEYTHGEGWSPSYTHGEPWGITDGNTGSPTYNKKVTHLHQRLNCFIKESHTTCMTFCFFIILYFAYLLLHLN